MSWDVSLTDAEGNELQSSTSIQEGETQVVGGTDDMSLSVTYNYGEIFRLCPGLENGFKDAFHGKKASDVQALLTRVVALLGTRKYEKDYWAPTPGNAGFALSVLLRWAKEAPDGIFSVH